MSIITKIDTDFILNIVDHEESSESIINYISKNIHKWENANIIWDISDFDFLPIKIDSVRKFIDLSLPVTKKREGTKSAVVVKTKLAYGMIRMIQLIAEYKIDIEISVFMNIDEAVHWIKS